MSSSADIDLDGLRIKYLAEREKRLRPDGNAQYRLLSPRDHALADPYRKALRERGAVTDPTEVAVIGGGLAGILMAVKLRDAGFEHIRIVESGGDFGGTWYWNRYPGAQCDIDSYLYLPLLEETGYMPTERYARSSEIRAHLQRIARHYNLYRDVLFETDVKSLDWDETSGHWHITSAQGDAFDARYVFVSNGPFSSPKLPGVAGLENFGGHVFHTSRWDYAYTGGDEAGNLTGLSGKRVGIIGTGCSAVQCIPHLADSAEHLHVFQRTPAAVDVRNNQPTDKAWFDALPHGWQRERMSNFVRNVHSFDVREDLVNDGWTRFGREVARLAADMARQHPGVAPTPEAFQHLIDLADAITMEDIRARVDREVTDPAIAKKLKPWYGHWCKRPAFHDEYLKTFNRPNVTLVDTDGHGVERVTAQGVVAGGQLYKLDCLILATGFETGTNYVKRLGFEIHGTGGDALSGKWGNGLRTFHGMHVHGYPNLFFTGTTQTAITYNYTNMLLEQTAHLAHILAHSHETGATRIEADAEAEQQWCEEIRRMAPMLTSYFTYCTPSYFSNEGNPADAAGILSGAYGADPQLFWQTLRAWRDEKLYRGLTFSKPNRPVR
ncbi:NAD(P)/FAD-dependent oxidoreductase [Paraburkholderia sp. PREW-6R]|uniref:flavin-containing monooxygenase n=1 Tax=Paraburkholderia sp. PREW-6R TaxID=3141544 RepID=UPI0031F5B4F3